MAIRSAEEWRALIEAQARSGLSMQRFCRERGVCPTRFSLRRKALGQEAPAEPSPFVRVERVVAPVPEGMGPRARLRLGRCEWELMGLAPEELARVMQALA
jgi:hypothetical protein